MFVKRTCEAIVLDVKCTTGLKGTSNYSPLQTTKTEETDLKDVAGKNAVELAKNLRVLKCFRTLKRVEIHSSW